MQLWCKRLVRLLAGASALAVSAATLAQGYPSRPVRIIVPFAPGGGIDVLARAYSGPLTAALAQPVIVENRPGNAGILAADMVARSAPDGYTLLVCSNDVLVFNRLFYKKLAYDADRDLTPVGWIGHSPIALFVHSSVPARTLAELIAYAKANPGKLNYGSGGVGHAFHVPMELFQYRTDTRLTHVPYKGAALVVQDIMAGRIDAMFYIATGQVLGQVKEGKLRALATVNPRRLEALPDTPTFDELGISDFNAAGIIALVTPTGTPRDVIERLNREVNKAMTSSELKNVYQKLSIEPVGGAPEVLAEKIKKDIAIWAPLAKRMNISLD
jgi:tripartite-type tricarboxylate transporter receptor subunit TctC